LRKEALPLTMSRFGGQYMHFIQNVMLFTVMSSKITSFLRKLPPDIKASG